MFPRLISQSARAVGQIAALRKSRRVIRHRGSIRDLEEKVMAYYRSAEGKEYYDTLAGLDPWADMVRRDRFLDLCSGADSILDFGCGAGSLAVAIAAHFPGKKVFAVDTGRHAGSGIAKGAGMPEYRQGSVLDSIYPAGLMDLVISRFVIEHVVDPARMLAEVHRLLKPGGHLYLVYPHLMLKADAATVLREAVSWAVFSAKPLFLAPQIDNTTSRGDDGDAVWLANPVKIGRMLRNAGLRVALSRWTQSLIVARKEC